jgi:peptide deformylase
MAQALDAEPDGVALAAPQVGVSKRLFIVRYDRLVSANEEPSAGPALGVYINPEFVKSSRRRLEMDEGCLSVRGVYGKTVRHDRATVRAYDASGMKFERGGGGVLAQVFQHETDHLNGILFTDHAHEQFETRREAPHHEE